MFLGRSLKAHKQIIIDITFFLQAIENCVSTAGFSIGEYAALVLAGAMTFSDGKITCLPTEQPVFWGFFWCKNT